MPKFKNSNATFWVIFKQCVTLQTFGLFSSVGGKELSCRNHISLLIPQQESNFLFTFRKLKDGFFAVSRISKRKIAHCGMNSYFVQKSIMVKKVTFLVHLWVKIRENVVFWTFWLLTTLISREKLSKKIGMKNS